MVALLDIHILLLVYNRLHCLLGVVMTINLHISLVFCFSKLIAGLSGNLFLYKKGPNLL
jgi:hypothetical protein